uniref:vesicle-trafficking protein SEC22b-like n=1 Tax=Jaculus jaculus TaxID=51337 RepID=UPI001E1B3662|nr:vesicle-trafficking protein SEC22b-like [Jaculus jaculus]
MLGRRCGSRCGDRATRRAGAASARGRLRPPVRRAPPRPAPPRRAAHGRPPRPPAARGRSSAPSAPGGALSPLYRLRLGRIGVALRPGKTVIAQWPTSLLVASMQEDEQSGRDLQQYQSQAKQLVRKLNEQSPTRCTLEAGAMPFHCIIEQGCVTWFCVKLPKKLACAYLEDLHSEFDEQYGRKVPTVSRPYSFIEFDTSIQKTKKNYIDSRARRNLGSINTELQDVQRIMVANIEEVLQWGEALSALDSKANNLSSLSKKFHQDVKYLNTCSTYAKLTEVAVFLIMLIVYVRFWWL